MSADEAATIREALDMIPYMSEADRAELDKLLTVGSPIWMPQVGPQSAAAECQADILFYGGSAGGGKTDLGIGLALTEHEKSIIFRREAVQLVGIEERITEILGSRDGFASQDGIWRLPDMPGLESGRTLELGSVKDPNDWTKYQGRPHDLIVFDEIPHFLELQVRALMGWRRTGKVGVRQRVVFVGNPPTDSDGEWIIGFFAPWLDPLHPGIADKRIEQAQLRLTTEIIDQVTLVRQAWVRAVAAEQSLKYADQVFRSAEASAELARRMEAVGNLNKITRARQQAFYADSATQFANAKQTSVSRREELVRALGLSEAQAKELKLPNRLPDLPKQPPNTEFIAQQAGLERLDIRLATTTLEAAAKAQGLNNITSFTDIELGFNRGTKFDSASGESTPKQGYEISIRLPIFDWGNMSRDAMNAQTLAAFNRLEGVTRNASSNLRETYSAYRTAYDISQHYRKEVIPVRKAIAEESQLRYNGMIIGVFELIADSRDQVSAVIAAINAQQQFWLTDAALQSSLIGRPTILQVPSVTGAGMLANPAGH